jgi:hypothetical protein
MNDRNNTGDEGKRPHEETELTPQEKQAFETLPRDKMPSAALEDRVVGALQKRGALEAPRGRVVVLNARRVVAVVAASVALLAGGFAMGQWEGARQAQTGDIVIPEATDISIAAKLQRTGSEYVQALELFAELPDSVDGDLAVQGREVALTTLYTAADQITRLVPKEELARQLLTALDARPTAGTTVEGPRIIEF